MYMKMYFFLQWQKIGALPRKLKETQQFKVFFFIFVFLLKPTKSKELMINLELPQWFFVDTCIHVYTSLVSLNFEGDITKKHKF